MTDRDEAIKQEATPAAGFDPAGGGEPSDTPAPVAEAAAEPLEAQAAPAGNGTAGAQGDPLAGEVPGAGDGAATPSGVAADLEALRARAGERDEYLALAQRAQADFENYRRRMARETAQAMDRGTGRLAKELLPALDHLELALKAAEAEGGELFKGVRMVQDEMLGALARVGIEAFAPVGEPFDPNEQEAMVQRPAEGFEAGTVAEVYQQGYRLNGVVLRPARVVVAA
jgi:molecular chaperone GrpE